MFEKGDMVDIVYTNDMPTHGIAFDIISEMMKCNPHKVTMRHGRSRPSYYLEGGSSKFWPYWMLAHSLPREPDWEV
jgi:hypothetical protein